MIILQDDSTKQSISFRLGGKTLKWLARGNQSRSKQLRQDLTMLEALLRLSDEKPNITLLEAVKLIERQS